MRRDPGWPPSWIDPKLEIIKKLRKLKVFDARPVQSYTIKHFGAFRQHFMLFHLKMVKNTHFASKIGLAIRYSRRHIFSLISRFSPNLCQNV